MIFLECTTILYNRDVHKFHYWLFVYVLEHILNSMSQFCGYTQTHYRKSNSENASMPFEFCLHDCIFHLWCESFILNLEVWTMPAANHEQVLLRRTTSTWLLKWFRLWFSASPTLAFLLAYLHHISTKGLINCEYVWKTTTKFTRIYVFIENQTCSTSMASL